MKTQITKCADTGTIRYSRNHYSIEFTAKNDQNNHMIVIADKNTKTATYAHIDHDHLIELAQMLLIQTK